MLVILSVLDAGALEWVAVEPPYPMATVSEETQKQCYQLLDAYICCILATDKKLTSEDVDGLGRSPPVVN